MSRSSLFGLGVVITRLEALDIRHLLDDKREDLSLFEGGVQFHGIGEGGQRVQELRVREVSPFQVRKEAFHAHLLFHPHSSSLSTSVLAAPDRWIENDFFGHLVADELVAECPETDSSLRGVGSGA
jgi:hypothetical protein